MPTKEETAAMFELETISGSDLRNLSESGGIGLRDVQQVTKISPAVLEAIEIDEIVHLSPTTHPKSFHKSYAEILQVDTNTTVEGYLKNIGEG